MSKKTPVASASAAFVFTLTDAKGNTTNIEAQAPMDEAAIGRVLGTAVRTAGSYRLAALSFLRWVYSSPALDTYRCGETNACDKEDGKTSNLFKAAVRKAEDQAVAMLVSNGSLKLKDNKAVDEFLSGLRADSNYSNAKNTTNKYVAFVSQNVTDQGFIVPIEVQRARIAEALPKKESDKSIAAMFKAIEERMGAVTIDEDDAVDSLVIARALFQTLEGIVKGMAVTATEVRTGVDVAANAALAKAAAGSVKVAA